MNPSVNIFKDTVINLNALITLSRDNYSKEDLATIEAASKMAAN